MELQGTTALVTGANRGVGRRFVDALLRRGAKKVYLAVRRLDTAVPLVAQYGSRVAPVELDVLRPELIEAAARRCTDVEVLVNNAGINAHETFLSPRDPDAAEQEMRTNYLGTLRMCRAFAPALTAHRQSGIVNMVSILANVCLPPMGSLCASKAAALALAEGVRAELRPRGVRVVAVLAGVIDTDMERDFPPPKADPADVAAAALDALAGGAETIYPDAMARSVLQRLQSEPDALRAEFAGYLAR